MYTRRFLRRNAYNLLMATFVVLLVITYLAPRIIVRIGPGEGGVLYRLLRDGTQLDRVYPEGLHFISPVNEMFVYDLRTHEISDSIAVLSFNGLTIRVNASLRFRPIAEELPYLHQEVGPDYVRKVVLPSLFASIREVVGKYKPEELYTTHTITMQEEIIIHAREAIRGKHVQFETIMVRNIQLPDIINLAIERKLRTQQEYQEMEFRIKREEREAQRKRIEARGIQEYSRVRLPTTFLTYRGIQATENLARSRNAKVVVIGSGSDSGIGLPIIMGDLRTPEEEAGAAGTSVAGAAAFDNPGATLSPTPPEPPADRAARKTPSSAKAETGASTTPKTPLPPDIQKALKAALQATNATKVEAVPTPPAASAAQPGATAKGGSGP